VLVLPDANAGVSGAAESEAFSNMTLPDESDVQRVSHLVLMAMMPALLEDDIASFGRALTAIQEINGAWFAPVQGGTFAPGLPTDIIALMRAHDAPGIGQSSWGPAVYAVVDGDEAARKLELRINEAFAGRVSVYMGELMAARGALVASVA
jgi:beta-RFAP synthase